MGGLMKDAETRTQTCDESCHAALRDAVGVLDAIEFGELLSAPPVALDERARHAAGTTLLAILSKRLRDAIGRR